MQSSLISNNPGRLSLLLFGIGLFLTLATAALAGLEEAGGAGFAFDPAESPFVLAVFALGLVLGLVGLARRSAPKAPAVAGIVLNALLLVAGIL